ncbi:hypothetical protein MRY87_00275 [bacterium]|nr:hypothetical protein [bacterium]
MDSGVSLSAVALLLVFLSGGFLKSFTALQIFRIGLGLSGATVGVLVLLFSGLLSLFVFHSYLPLDAVFKTTSGAPSERAGDSEEIQVNGSLEELQERVRPFLLARTNPETRLLLAEMQQELHAQHRSTVESVETPLPQPDSFLSLLLAFVLEDLHGAFQLGVLFILPFLLIDLIVAHLFQLLQVSQISLSSLSLTLKLLLFVAVDGWTLITERLVGDYLVL